MSRESSAESGDTYTKHLTIRDGLSALDILERTVNAVFDEPSSWRRLAIDVLRDDLHEALRNTNGKAR